MDKNKIYEFDPVIYPFKLWITFGHNLKNVADKYYNYDGTPIKYTDWFCATTTPVQRKKDKKLGVIICFRSKKYITYNTVAHEASHAAKFLFSHIGADMTEHEPFEYVLGWFAECCGKVKTCFK